MWRKSKYHISQASLEYFANAFNNLNEYKNIRWEYIRNETFGNDGYFLNIETGETLGFDWEIRDKYFIEDTFPFETFGQFERKMNENKSIKLSIQCSQQCSAIAIGWHEDFKDETVVNIKLATDSNVKQNGQTRYTKHFRVFKYDELVEFKALIKKAFDTKTYNHTIFNTEVKSNNDKESMKIYSFLKKYKDN